MKKTSYLTPVLLLFAIFIVVAVISEKYFFRIDLTAEKRYSLSDVSKELVENLKKPVDVILYLDGELPAGFRKLQQSIIQKIEDNVGKTVIL